jgi:hypothetical protein
LSDERHQTDGDQTDQAPPQDSEESIDVGFASALSADSSGHGGMPSVEAGVFD